MKYKSSQELMLQIDDTLISLDIIEKYFVCDLPKCKGNCCVYGDYGAPLEEKEIITIKKELDKIKPYMNDKALKIIESQGFYTKDDENELVTVLVDNKECVFTIFENGIAYCSIEKAYNNKDIDFQKPVSCHLYPVRVKKYKSFTAVNFNSWDICKSAIVKGKTTKTPVYRFLKEALIRKFGKEWYDELEIAAESLKYKS
ncbi:MAG: DUF3109 family protein [Marinilabiliales bacterium]